LQDGARKRYWTTAYCRLMDEAASGLHRFLNYKMAGEEEQKCAAARGGGRSSSGCRWQGIGEAELA
jgi:hypothetical protein